MQQTVESADAESQLEARRARIETALCDRLEEQWDAVLEQWTSATPAERRAVRIDVSALRTRLLDDLLEIGSLEELNRGLALQYLAVKCRWMVLDTQIQDRARNGQVDEELLYRATCVSLLLQALDPLLNRGDVDELTALLGEPLG